jgi:predicted nucleic acid-binding protein
MATVMVDAGPLVAYLKRDEVDHAWAQARFRELRQPLLTCDAVLSEAFFLLQGVHNGPRQLLGLFKRLDPLEQRLVWNELAHAVVPLAYEPLADEELTAIADQAFVLLDKEETHAQSR